MKTQMCSLALWLSVVVLMVVGSQGAEQPTCAKDCVNLPGVSQEIIKQIDQDDRETCKLHPDYKSCILKQCQVSELPQDMLGYLKEEYECDLSSASHVSLCLVTAILPLLAAIWIA